MMLCSKHIKLHSTKVKMSQLVNKILFATELLQACQQVVAMLLFYQVATRLSLTTCWQIVELQDDDKLLEQLVTSLLSSITLWQVVNGCKLSRSRWQLVEKLATSLLRTRPVDKLLEQHCYKSAAGLLQLVKGCHSQLVDKLLNCRTITSCWNNF
jgi:hypothetical protein